jgi:hypothetical protein
MSELSIGPHGFVPEDPQTVRLKFVGVIEGEHARRAIAESEKATGGKPFVILCETHGMKNVTPDARKVFADGFGKAPLAAVAMIGSNIRTRAIATFVITAINVFRTTKLNVAFFDDEPAARKWVADELKGWSGTP